MPPSVEQHPHPHPHEPQPQQHTPNNDSKSSSEVRVSNSSNKDELTEQEVIYVNTFSEYCRAFYTASLQCRSSSSTASLSSSLCSSESDDDEEKGKNDGKRSSSQELTKEDGQVVLQAFDYASSCCSTTPPPPSQPSPSSLYQNHLSTLPSTQLHHLEKCGFATSSLPETLTNKPCLRECFTFKKNEERKRAHRISMFQRHSTLSNIVSLAESQQLSQSTPRAVPEREEEELPRFAKQEELTTLHSTITSFCSKYSAHIGTHSFLAGLLKLMETQIGQGLSDTNIVQWKFRQVVLSEAVIPGTKEDEYVKEAVELLLSFLVRIKDDDLEAPHLPTEEHLEESVPEDVGEKTTCWEIEPSISDHQLSKLMGLFPKELHARPTGTFEVVVLEEKEEGERRRRNVDGRFDEVGWGGGIFSSWCTMLSIL